MIDAKDFLLAPEAHLRWLCDWPETTGFEPWRPRGTSLSDHDAAVAEACRPI